MAWTTPKIDWTPLDGIIDDDLNEIGENLNVLHKGNGQTALAEIASANNLDINETDDTFLITGTTSVYFIKSTGRQPGNRIHLIKLDSGGAVFHDNEADPGVGYSPMALWPLTHSQGDLTLNPDQCFTFVYTGTKWVLT